MDQNTEPHQQDSDAADDDAQTRTKIFEALLEEFSRMVKINNKDVIQKAATMQALSSHHLSNKNNTIIDFDMFGDYGCWYQLNILKLAMRVYHETKCEVSVASPSIIDDEKICLEHLKSVKKYSWASGPSKDHVKAFQSLKAWLTKDLDSGLYSFQGPVLKPLQSLFNKLFIRRGQTSVRVIGDMVRATLLLDDDEMLRDIVGKVKSAFPNIMEGKFQHPDMFQRSIDFLNYVHDDLNFLPGSNVLPYRFKRNNSQKKRSEPLWYNFNFFLEIPEFHRAGQTEMFVACELQIGLTDEINDYRKTYVAYGRDRILSNQPLLKNYDAAMNTTTENLQSNCSNDDIELIKKVLSGQIVNETLSLHTTTIDDDNDDDKKSILFENGRFSLSADDIEEESFLKPDRLCLNNRSLNWHAPVKQTRYNDHFAFVVAGPYKLDDNNQTKNSTSSTQRYFVHSFTVIGVKGTAGTVGLYAHVGPYVVQVACFDSPLFSEDIVVVDSGKNFTFSEEVCPLPIGTTALEVIAHGSFGSFEFEKLELALERV